MVAHEECTHIEATSASKNTIKTSESSRLLANQIVLAAGLPLNI